MNDFTIGILLAVGQFILVGVLSLVSRPKVATVYAEPEPVAPRRPRSSAPVVEVPEVAEVEPVAIEVAPIEEPASVIVAYGESEESLIPEPVVPLATPEADEQPAPVAVGAKPLQGKRVCVTGKLPYKRKHVEDFIVALGGTISGSITRSTDFLIYDIRYDNHVNESAKHAKACDLGIPILNWESFLGFCGLPIDYDIYSFEKRDFWVNRETRREYVEYRRAYGKEYERMSSLLKKILCGDFLGRVSCEIKKDLKKPVSVVVRCDDTDQEDIEVLRICRYEVTPSPNPRYDGDFLFYDKEGNECDFKSLTVDSIARILAVYGISEKL